MNEGTAKGRNAKLRHVLTSHFLTSRLRLFDLLHEAFRSTLLLSL
jgi:hypothetical protein